MRLGPSKSPQVASSQPRSFPAALAGIASDRGELAAKTATSQYLTGQPFSHLAVRKPMQPCLNTAQQGSRRQLKQNAAVAQVN
jgi:hypothetical protein